MNANERRLKTNTLIGVHSRSSAAESAIVHFSEHLLALGKMFSRILVVA
jgi:hypothetical protein